jgi:hypothetical protein
MIELPRTGNLFPPLKRIRLLRPQASNLMDEKRVSHPANVDPFADVSARPHHYRPCYSVPVRNPEVPA